jgi:hypothetical protein
MLIPNFRCTNDTSWLEIVLNDHNRGKCHCMAGRWRSSTKARRKERVGLISEIHHRPYLRYDLDPQPNFTHPSTYTPPLTKSSKMPDSKLEDISDSHLTTLFDQLVSEGVIVYGPHTKHLIEDESYPVRHLHHTRNN